jgi:hypothetical protein
MNFVTRIENYKKKKKERGENLTGRCHLGEGGLLCMGGRTVLTLVLRKFVVRLECIHMALDMVQWQLLMNVVMNLHIP